MLYLHTNTAIYRQYGVKAIPLKPLLHALVSFFDHPDPTVRAEASALTVELYRWLGTVVRTQIDSLRPAQVKELEAAFEEVKAKGPAVPEKFTRSHKPQVGGPPPPQEGISRHSVTFDVPNTAHRETRDRSV
jgi:hypothetical protein